MSVGRGSLRRGCIWPRAGIFRALRVAAIALLSATAIASAAVPAAAQMRHGLSAFGALKYPPGFEHFDYVNPNAPKGGRLAMIGTAGRITFNSFNGYILKGDAAQGLDLLFDSLMVRALDEPDAVYGLVAKAAELGEDGKSVTFTLRPEARFADGSPLTAEDVAFSFKLLKEKGHPAYALELRDVESAEVLGPHKLRYGFKGGNLRDLPLIVAQLPIFSKAYYTAHPFDESTLALPLGSGPYEIADFKQGTFVTFRRRKDYWARDLPVNRGQYNFDTLRYEYYRDRTAEFEALKAGAYDLREEFTSKAWATAYDIPQVRSGRLKRMVLPDGLPSGAQGFFINTRRAKFADRRVREALDLAFDFEWTNKNLFYGFYQRTTSFFENSDIKASGKPSAAELALLEPYRKQLPLEVFGAAIEPPRSNGSGQDRHNLRRASRLLSAAGWIIKNGQRINAKTGEPLRIEFLIFSPSFERVIAPYVKNLKILGVNATIRRVDPAQYEERVKSFDFDITTQRYVLNPTPGPEIWNYWGSAAAGAKGNFNLAGIKSPVVDALIEKMLSAKSREDLRTAANALDRVLRAGHYWVPHWFTVKHRLAFWDKFSWPKLKPRYNRGVILTWWYDAKKAASLAQPQ